MIRFVFIIILGVVVWVLPVQAQSNATQYWNTEQGLSNGWISQITQDEQGYLWLATQYGLNRFDGYEFEHYQYEPNNSNSLSSNWVYSMAQDSSGIIWTMAYISGVNAFDPKTETAQYYPLWTKDSIRASSVRYVACDAQQTIWASSSLGLFAKKADEAAFQQVFDQHVFDYQLGVGDDLFLLTNQHLLLFDKKSQATKIIYTFPKYFSRRIYLDHANVLWTFGKNQLLQITKNGKDWQATQVPINNLEQSSYFVTSPIYEDQQHRLWVAGKEGLSVIDAQRQSAKKIGYESLFPKGKKGQAISFFEDRHDNFWIGTTNGLILMPAVSKRFELSEPIPHLDQFTNAREIIQIDQTLWLATLDGLFRIDLRNPQLPPQKVLNERIFSLLLGQDGFLYAAKYQLYRIDLQKLTVTTFGEERPTEGVAWSMAQDRSGKIWLGKINILQRFDPQTEQLDNFPHTKNRTLATPPSQSLLFDQNGNLWAGSVNTGLYFLDNPTEIKRFEEAAFRQINYDATNKNSLSNRSALFTVEDPQGMIWVATDAGLNRINPQTFAVKRYLKKDGLQDEKVTGLTVDEAGDIWGSTIGHGLFRLDTKTDVFTFYDENDGLASNNYLLSSVFKNEQGQLFFGSDNQVQVVEPQRVKAFPKPKIPFLFNDLVVTNQDKTKLLLHQSTIDLSHDYQSFTVAYATLNFFQAERTSYKYWLEGVHSDWQDNGHQRTLTFTGLKAGAYQLKVKAVNPDLQFIEDTIKLNITIAPPWWQTWWAYSLYGLLGITGILLAYRFQLNRQLEKAETQRLQELDTLKTRFFTNITHELRTPLTLILGVADQLKKSAKKEIQQKAGLIGRNGQQLLDLINQILDLSKLESGKLSIQLVHGDLIPYLNYLLESFHSVAAEKNIRLHFLAEVPTLLLDYDAEKIKQIAQNLLANALKHTPENGNIYLQVRQSNNKAALIFRDTGKGIHPNQLPHIFERFYQTDSKNYGSGIGLSLTKEVVDLLGGNITVQSQLGKGSTFTITLPIQQNAQTPLAVPIESNTTTTLAKVAYDLAKLNDTKAADTPLLLLVEDNEDVLYFLVDCLKNQYRLATAADGQIGIDKALAEIPDLVISDVMMPKKDGFEVCQILKTTDRTNHIPIILLTAKADQTSKLEGLEHGADAYVLKPFVEAELQVRIKKLLELRQRLQQRYQSSDFWEKSALPTTTIEDEFVIKVRQIVEANLTNSDFGIPQLCQKIGISRVHLHRKLKALTNQSTTQFINRIRLQKARILLTTSQLNISEIAYEVGFSDPAYFSRLYSDVFGESPSVTRK
ncbi:MAG: ATP-binding protein [Bacteroidota bacterium]